MECYRVEAWDILQHLFKVKRINNHILHFAATFTSNLDVERMKHAVDLLADAFPLIRCGYDETGARPVWVDKGHTADAMVSLIQTQDAGQSARQFLCEELNLAQGPQMQIGVIRGGDTDILGVRMNHMLCDAAGFKEILYALGSIYTALENQTEVSVGSMVRDRSVRQILHTFPLWDRFRIFFSKSGINPRGDQKFDLEGCLTNPFIVTRKIPRGQFRALKSYAKSYGASVNDMMLTAYLRLLFRIFGKAPALPCTIDLRRFLEGRRAKGVCNMVTSICCNIGPDIDAEFQNTLVKVKQTMDLQKTDRGSIKSIALLELLFSVCPCKTATGLLEKHFTNAPIAFTNIGVLDKDRLAFGKTGMAEAFMTGSVKYSPQFQIALSTYDDEATLSVNLMGTQADRAKIEGILDGFIAELRSAAPC